MQSDALDSDDRSRRLHPASLLFNLGSIIRRFLVPGLAAIWLGGRGDDNYEIVAMILAVPAMLYSLAKYVSLHYRFGKGELIIREGILSRNERHIPYHRIQNIDITRNIVHRALGVVDVIIHSASGTEPEAVLRVLTQDDVDAMRQRVFAGQHERAQTDEAPPVVAATGPAISTEPQAAEHVIARAGIGDLVVFGIISNRGTVALAAVMGLMWQFDLWPSRDAIEGRAESLLGVSHWSFSFAALIVICGLVAIVIGLRLLSVAWTILTLFDFSLTQNDDELRTRFGLLTQHAMTIPRHRIQLIDIEATLLHRLFRRAAIRARTAGVSKGEQSGTRRDWLMPILRRQDVSHFVKRVQPELEFDSVDWLAIHPRAKRRIFVKSMVVSVIGAGVASAAWYPWGGLAFPLMIAWAISYAHLKVKHTAYGITDRAVWFRTGWLHRTWRAVRYNKIQAVSIAESPFDRLHAHAAVRIDTANAGVVQDAIVIRYLGRDVADAAYDRFASEAAVAEFRW